LYYLSKNKESGFTLVELLIAMTIGLIILAALSSTFLMQRKIYDVQEQIVEMVQNARAAMDIMTREIRMAGYGAPTSDLSTWIDWVPSPTPTINANPTIEEGGSDPDIIHIVGCFDSPASLSASASSSTTSLILQNAGEANKFNTDKKKLISIDGLENAIITGISGSTLTINQGLSRDYGVDTPIYLVKVIGYSIVEENNTPILKRNENTGGGRQPLAENIEDLQISPGNSINVSLTARTSEADADYTDPTHGDHYRRYTLTSVITPRNLGL
jgi:prepilin-type N-terminal cleavage/methylation domain-containing protein